MYDRWVRDRREISTAGQGKVQPVISDYFDEKMTSKIKAGSVQDILDMK